MAAPQRAGAHLHAISAFGAVAQRVPSRARLSPGPASLGAVARCRWRHRCHRMRDCKVLRLARRPSAREEPCARSRPDCSLCCWCPRSAPVPGIAVSMTDVTGGNSSSAPSVEGPRSAAPRMGNPCGQSPCRGVVARVRDPPPARAVPRALQHRSRARAPHQPGGAARVAAAAGAAVAHRGGAGDGEHDPHARGPKLGRRAGAHAGDADACRGRAVPVERPGRRGQQHLPRHPHSRAQPAGAPAPRPRRCCATTAASAAPTRPTAGAIPRACWRAPASCAASCWPAPRRWPWQRDSWPRDR